jgi:RNA recognition motif-containing protein
VEFEDPEDTKDAIDNMDQSEFFGKVIKVNAAKPPKNVNEGLGSKTALWEQVSLLMILEHHQRLIQRYRKAGWQRMLLVRRIGWQQKGLDPVQTGQMIPCKAWKVWMWLGQSRHRTRALWGGAIIAVKHYCGVLGGQKSHGVIRKKERRSNIHTST